MRLAFLNSKNIIPGGKYFIDMSTPSRLYNSQNVSIKIIIIKTDERTIKNIILPLFFWNYFSLSINTIFTLFPKYSIIYSNKTKISIFFDKKIEALECPKSIL